MSVAFSSDGTAHCRRAIMTTATTVAILRGRDLNTGSLFPRSRGVSTTTWLKVAWSKDGRRLFAGGYKPFETGQAGATLGPGGWRRPIPSTSLEPSTLACRIGSRF